MTRRVDVLIVTDEAGETDWQVDPARADRVNIVHIDYRALKRLFPDEIRDLARLVQSTSKGIPWREGVLQHLKAVHEAVQADIEGGVLDETDAGKDGGYTPPP